MKIIGLIVEYNPFHFGHKNHIEEAKKLFPNEELVFVAVMSGNVVQRGEFSIASKFDRTKEALENGVDVIVQLPPYYSLNSADLFAKGSIETLNKFGVDTIVFGSESNDIENLKQISTKLDSESFQQLLLETVKEVQSYPVAFSKVIGTEFNSNDILGINYIHWAKKINPNIEVLSIQRNNNDFISASKIRNHINSEEDVSNYTPMNDFQSISMDKFVNNFIFWIKTNSLDADIYKYMKNNVDENSATWLDLLSSLSNKTYTKARIARELLKGILEIKELDYETPRLLGVSNQGRVILKSSEAEYNSKFVEQYEDDLKIAKLIDLVLKTNYVDKEIKSNVIKKEDS